MVRSLKSTSAGGASGYFIFLVLSCLAMFGCASEPKDAVQVERNGKLVLAKDPVIIDYMNRIKGDVENSFKKTLKDKFLKEIRAEQEQKFNDGDLITEVKVMLDQTGNVKSAEVRKSSGWELLDRVEVESFKDAGSLAPPPKKYIRNRKFELIWRFVIEPGDLKH